MQAQGQTPPAVGIIFDSGLGNSIDEALALALLYGLEGKNEVRILALAVVANILGRFLEREMFGLPMNVVLQYVVPVLSIPALMLFKYGKQRGYLQDWVMFHARPHVYSALERDREFTRDYLRWEEGACR